MPYVHVTLATGRTITEKQDLMREVAQSIHTTLGAPLETVRVWITEVPVEEMSTGGVPLDEIRRQRALAADVDGG